MTKVKYVSRKIEIYLFSYPYFECWLFVFQAIIYFRGIPCQFKTLFNESNANDNNKLQLILSVT